MYPACNQNPSSAKKTFKQYAQKIKSKSFPRWFHSYLS